MAFGNITAALAIPVEATAVYVFGSIRLHPSGLPTLTCRHAGDGTRPFQKALERSVNAERARGGRKDQQYSKARVIDAQLDEAALIADHCVISWTGVYDEGEVTPSPCTPAKVLEFLTAIIRADGGTAEYRDFSTWIQARSTFAPPPGDAAELGKP